MRLPKGGQRSLDIFIMLATMSFNLTCFVTLCDEAHAIGGRLREIAQNGHAQPCIATPLQAQRITLPTILAGNCVINQKVGMGRSTRQ
jgi:hypothetical protein